MDYKEYEYLFFSEVEKKAKTSVWSMCNKNSGKELGVVKWHNSWRQYCFFPTVQAVYSSGCLDDMSDFLDLVNNR